MNVFWPNIFLYKSETKPKSWYSIWKKLLYNIDALNIITSTKIGKFLNDWNSKNGSLMFYFTFPRFLSICSACRLSMSDKCINFYFLSNPIQSNQLWEEVNSKFPYITSFSVKISVSSEHMLTLLSEIWLNRFIIH